MHGARLRVVVNGSRKLPTVRSLRAMAFALWAAVCMIGSRGGASGAEGPVVQRERQQRIWDAAPHNAFTSLLRHEDRWLCAFREASSHQGSNRDRGTFRILQSSDGQDWVSLATLQHSAYDLRDPKLSLDPRGQLMLLCGAAQHSSQQGVRFDALRTVVTFSASGRQWSDWQEVLGPWEWLWRLTWHQGAGYGVAYHVGRQGQTPRETRTATLYKTTDGTRYEPITQFQTPEGAGESTLRFEADGTARLVMRRDGGRQRALLGTASPPYTKWQLVDVAYRLGGPDLIQLGDGSWWLASRSHDRRKTVLARVDFQRGAIEEQYAIEGGPECGYPSLAWHDDRLWMTFYSSHEAKPAIYRATFAMGGVSKTAVRYDPTENYAEEPSEGFRILVNKTFCQAQPQLWNETRKLLAAQLYHITRVVPEAPLARLRVIPIWVEEAEPHHPCMCYHPDAGWLRAHGMNPDKAQCVELSNARNFLKWSIDQPWMVLHELAHGYHDRFLAGGYSNAELRAAHEDAVQARRYESVLRINGRTDRAYAISSPMEYFAETSEALFGVNDFYPFVRSELEQHDPKMYALLRKLWLLDGAPK
jgi:hypothetical protein